MQITAAIFHDKLTDSFFKISTKFKCLGPHLGLYPKMADNLQLVRNIS